MKPHNTKYALFFGVLTLLFIPSANAADYSSYTHKNAEFECFSDDKRSIDANEKELLYKVEA